MPDSNCLCLMGAYVLFLRSLISCVTVKTVGDIVNCYTPVNHLLHCLLYTYELPAPVVYCISVNQ